MNSYQRWPRVGASKHEASKNAKMIKRQGNIEEKYTRYDPVSRLRLRRGLEWITAEYTDGAEYC